MKFTMFYVVVQPVVDATVGAVIDTNVWAVFGAYVWAVLLYTYYAAEE